MGSLYLKNGAISLQGGSLAGECKCCDVFASRIGYTHYTMGPLPTGFQWQFVETEDDLYLCSVVLTGKLNTCQSYILNTSIADGLEDWVRAGGKFYYQNEYQGCGAASAAALAMSHAGSTMTAGNTRVAAGGGEVNDGETLTGYTASDNGQFCVSGLTWRGALSDTCVGGTALIDAPPYITGGLEVRQVALCWLVKRLAKVQSFYLAILICHCLRTRLAPTPGRRLYSDSQHTQHRLCFNGWHRTKKAACSCWHSFATSV